MKRDVSPVTSNAETSFLAAQAALGPLNVHSPISVSAVILLMGVHHRPHPPVRARASIHLVAHIALNSIQTSQRLSTLLPNADNQGQPPSRPLSCLNKRRHDIVFAAETHEARQGLGRQVRSTEIA